MNSSEADIKIRNKAQLQTVCHKLKEVWNSTLSGQIKIKLFIAIVKLVKMKVKQGHTDKEMIKAQCEINTDSVNP